MSGSGKSVKTEEARLHGYFVRNTVELPDHLNYYAIRREKAFNNTFDVAATMSGKVKEPDFSEDMVIAIVGKPTNREFTIDIVKTELVDNTLNVHYEVNYTWKDLSYTVKPAVLMTVSKDLDASRVNFYSQNTLRHSIEL